VDGLWAGYKSKDVGLGVRAISFQDFKPTWFTIHERYRQTDGQHAIARQRFALYWIAW